MFGLGLATVVAVVATVLLAFGGTLLIGRWIGVSPGMGLMAATGFSVCGASAIAAMDSVTESDKEEVATAVTLVTLYGSAAIALVPLIGSALGLGAEPLGAWAGLSVHEVAQVVAAASPAGSAAVAIAVIIKLTCRSACPDGRRRQPRDEAPSRSPHRQAAADRPPLRDRLPRNDDDA